MSTFDPSKRYTWEEDSQIVLTGSQFGIILNTLRTVLDDVESQKIIMLHKASVAAEEVLKNNVNSGVAKEVPMQQAPQIENPGPPPPQMKVVEEPTTE